MSRNPVEQNILGVQQLVGSRMNKINSGTTMEIEGIEGEFEDEFTLKLDDEELLHLAQQIENKYAGYEAEIKLRQEANRTYYLGKQKQGSATADGMPIASNLLFEAEETFLPAALSKNPEPVVWSDNTPEGTAISHDIKAMLQYHADTLVLRRKLNRMTRHWTIYFLGVIKHGWNKEINDITSDVRKPQNFIFDPDACIDEYGDYDGPLLGERMHCKASDLVKLFPKHKEYITVMVNGKMGTKVTYTEWWSDEYCFYTFKGKVLDKNKNPHFNYTKVVEEQDIDGNVVAVEQKGRNHFAKPKKPYTFLSVISLGEQPHDITNPIEQNIPNQNLVTRRTNQIDINLSRSNNSIALSGMYFNEEEATQAARALEIGNPVLVPDGNINDAIGRFPAEGFPDSAFKQLETSKQDLRSIFGTEGISSQPGNENTTARGMILNQQFDNTRIGGGIGDALEQVVDNIFNCWVQLYYVYYDQEHFGTVMGAMKAVEYVTISSENLDRRIVISVAPDSMKPKDEITEMNQAMSLWEAGALDPKTLLTMLNFPDPQTTAENTVLWLIDKNAYIQLNFPELAQKLADIQQQAAASQGAPPGGPPSDGSVAPSGDLSSDPASAALSQVPLPQ